MMITSSSLHVENFYAHVVDKKGEFIDDLSVLPSSRRHVWFRPVELGSASLKAGVTLSTNANQRNVVDFKGLVSALCVEWSTCLVDVIKTIASPTTTTSTDRHHGNDDDRGSSLLQQFDIDIDVSINEVTALFVGKRPGTVYICDFLILN